MPEREFHQVERGVRIQQDEGAAFITKKMMIRKGTRMKRRWTWRNEERQRMREKNENDRKETGRKGRNGKE
jgi:hypothetical protein